MSKRSLHLKSKKKIELKKILTGKTLLEAPTRRWKS